jgi:hypothetical protein
MLAAIPWTYRTGMRTRYIQRKENKKISIIHPDSFGGFSSMVQQYQYQVEKMNTRSRKAASHSGP